ncbi:MAG: hypothetical protein M0Z76_04930 [Gammaproteobacteria bacterium]|nr:hypothetical protein [Gammaproteobacteria bacterium]
MTALLGIFVRIGLLVGKPQDLPASTTLPILTAILAFLTNYAVDTGFAREIHRLDFALAQTGLLAVWIGAAISLRRVWVRYSQTLSAVYGGNILINLVTWPLSFESGIGAFGAKVLGIVLALWLLAIVTKILAHALEVPILLSALISLTGLQLSGWILISLFPLPKS